ncbi:MAG: DUF2079 domain-containing protein [Thermoplasmata archaeon]
MLRDPFLLGVLVGVGLYSWYWSQLTISRFYSMHAGVYDLGLFMAQTWRFTQPQLLTPTAYLGLAFDQPFQVILSPLGLIDSYPLILAVQSVALCAGAVPLYFVARQLLSSRPISLLISLSFLVYPPMAGVNWFDAHFIAFFIPLFLTGYALYLRNHLIAAIIVLFIAATTEYPAVLFVALFSFTLVAQGLVDSKLHRRPWDQANRRFAALLLCATIAFFIYQFLYLGGFNLGSAWQAFTVTAHTPQQSGSGTSLENRLLVAVVLLVPLLFLPLFTPRWLILVAPFLVLVFSTAYFGLTYPYILQDQYTAVFVPFAFLGVIYSLSFLTRVLGSTPSHLPPNRPADPSPRPFSQRKDPRPIAIAISVFVVSLLFCTAYQPYGPFNSEYGDNFNLQANTQVNETYFNAVQTAISLVPRDTPYLLFQNDMPTALPRPLDYFQTPLVSGIDGWQNLSLYDVEQNAFPLQTPDGAIFAAQIDYLVDAPYSWGFTEQGTIPNNTMYHFVRTLYESGKYGVLGDIDGNVVLERGYDQSPIDYQPYKTTVLASSMYTEVPFEPSGDRVLSVSNLSFHAAWDGPFVFLSPGWYSANFSLMTTSDAPSNYIVLVAMANWGNTIFGASAVRGSSFSQTNHWEDFRLNFYVNDTYQFVAFPGLSVSWNGTLSLRSIQLTQIAPPTPTFDGSLGLYTPGRSAVTR